MKKIALIMALFVGIIIPIQAQAPYKHSVGISLGSMQALSYKSFLTDHLAIQIDFGTKITQTVIGVDWGKYGVSADETRFSPINIWTLEINQNVLYEGHFVKGLYGLVGGGVSIGYNWSCWYSQASPHFYSYTLFGNRACGKFGANAMLGLEYKFYVPVVLQLDIRPGYGLIFQEAGKPLGHYVDWSVNLGVRYTL